MAATAHLLIESFLELTGNISSQEKPLYCGFYYKSVSESTDRIECVWRREQGWVPVTPVQGYHEQVTSWNSEAL